MTEYSLVSSFQSSSLTYLCTSCQAKLCVVVIRIRQQCTAAWLWVLTVLSVLCRAYDYNPDKGGEASQQEAPGVQASATNAPKMAQHVRQPSSPFVGTQHSSWHIQLYAVHQYWLINLALCRPAVS